MTEELRPMLNTSAETESSTAEEFKNNLIGRMDRAHEAHAQLNRALAESPEHAEQRVQKFKQEFIAHVTEMTGLSFDADGRCTTPEEVKMDGEIKECWAHLCQEFSGNQDPQQAEKLLREAGRILRGAAGVRQEEASRDVGNAPRTTFPNRVTT
jgi:hypothetical protein